MKYAPFTFIGSEQPVQEDIEIHSTAGVFRSHIGGTIDRMDMKDNTFRIVDYKTGGHADTPLNVESLFIPDAKRSGYVFQTFLYAAIVCRKLREKGDMRQVAPSLLYIHQAASEDYTPVIRMGEPRKAEPVEDFARFESEFRDNLDQLLTHIFSPEIPFIQTDEPDACAFCDFKELCKK